MAACMRFFFIIFAVAASDLDHSESIPVCALEEVLGNLSLSLSKYFLALSLDCTDARVPISLISCSSERFSLKGFPRT